jgi:hypothetical protein
MAREMPVRGLGRPLLMVALCVVVIAATRGQLAETAKKMKERSDAYALPPARVLPIVSMGYKQALADTIWAYVLVAQGLRFQERRPFEHLPLYLDAIYTLDPKFREPYKYADTLLTFQVNDRHKEQNVRFAREFLERGLKEHPTDAELWMNYGEFLAYVAPGSLSEERERAAWREQGAAALMRAGQLGSKDEYLLWHSVSAVGLLSDKKAEREGLIHFLERVYAMTEDLELREHVLKKLQILMRDQQESRVIQQQKAFDDEWRRTSFVARTQLRVIGPKRDTWKCAGFVEQGVASDHCDRDWPAWSRSLGLGDPSD